MFEFFSRLFDTSSFSPRWYCGNWTDAHGWLHILSDLGVWSAYIAIPCVLAAFVVRRRDIPFRGVFVLFVLFIFACGTTHLMEALIFWWPAYRLAGLIKFLTAVVSWATVIALIPVVPKALAMRSPEELEREIAARAEAEANLRRAHAELETQVRNLKASEERFRIVVDGVKDHALILLDTEGRVVSWNSGAERIKQYAADEIVGRHFSRFYPEEDVAAGLPARQLHLAQAESKCEVEGWRVRKDGSRFWANVIITALHDESGKPRGFSKVTRDITERKNAEENARRLLQEEAARRAAEEYTETIRLQGDQLRESDRRKTTFLAILSHELRNPLAPIRNALHLLQQAGDRPEIRAQALGLMDRQVRHMVRLVDDLLDISRISSDRLQLRKDRLDIAEAIDLAVETSSPVIETAGHRLTVTRADGPVWVDGDGARLAQVFSNLLNNAARYTPRGGSIRIGLERHDDAAVVTVSDNGLGIPPDMLGRVFDMFSNVSTALERTQGGLGIGLSLVRRLVEMHGGSVEARSAGLGRGAEFVVRLPVTPAPQARPGSPPAPLRQPPPAQPMGRRILVVDDNHDAAQTLALLLKSVGAEVRMAYDGMEALAAAAAFQPEVVLLDIGLPKLNGYEVARQLRAQPWAGDTVIIATTGWGQEDDRRKALEAGFDSHLVKPVNFKVIEEIVVDPRRVRPAVRA